MTQLVVAILVFLGTHTIPALPRLRGGLIARLGWTGYLAAYSALSLAVVGWIGVAYVAAPYVPVWDYDPRLNWAPFLIMPLVCVLMVAGLCRANPLSVTLLRGGYDPQRPGILAVTRHPVPWGFVLWAGTHMVPNGDVASLLLFGLLLSLGLAGMWGVDAKMRRTLGTAEWQRLARPTSLWPRPRLARGLGRDLLIAVPAGVGGYVLLLSLHAAVIGVSPFPPGL